MGSIHDTQTLLFTYRDAFHKKVADATNTLTNTLHGLLKSIGTFSLAKPKPFLQQFSLQRRKSCLTVSDALNSV